MHIIDTVLSAPETYAVVLKETGLPIGSVGIKRGKDSAAVTNSKEAEVGCWIGKTYWNNGYATEAVMALIGRCFNNLRCNRIWYCYFAGNERSKRVAEKAGFKYHQRGRCHMIIVNLHELFNIYLIIPNPGILDEMDQKRLKRLNAYQNAIIDDRQ